MRRRGPDPAVRAACLRPDDLAILLLRKHLAVVPGEDPLSAASMTPLRQRAAGDLRVRPASRRPNDGEGETGCRDRRRHGRYARPAAGTRYWAPVGPRGHAGQLVAVTGEDGSGSQPC
jgi:hypothetical protein